MTRDEFNNSVRAFGDRPDHERRRILIGLPSYKDRAIAEDRRKRTEREREERERKRKREYKNSMRDRL